MLRVRPGTKQALAELMAWAEIEKQGEALTLMIHYLHGVALGRPRPRCRFRATNIEHPRSWRDF